MSFSKAFRIIGSILFLFWLVHFISHIKGINLISWGIEPGSYRGLLGIIFSPFIHSDFSHLMSNSSAFLILGLLSLGLYGYVGLKVIIYSTLISGLGIWLIGRPTIHIGASGIVYGLGFFLLISAIIRRDRKSGSLALIVCFLYGSLIWGVLPLKDGVSWEGHLFGAFAGIITALYYRKIYIGHDKLWTKTNTPGLLQDHHKAMEYLNEHLPKQGNKKSLKPKYNIQDPNYPPIDSYVENWRKYRLAIKLGWSCLFLAFWFGLLSSMDRIQALLNENTWRLLFFTSFIGGIVLALVIHYWPCPRCKKLFFSTLLGRMTSEINCIHCHLPQFAINDVDLADTDFDDTTGDNSDEDEDEDENSNIILQ